MCKFGKFLVAYFLLFVSLLIGTQNGYSQSSNTWSATGQMTQARTRAAAALLANGKVLITGGSDNNGVPQASTEMFDPGTGQFSPAAPMNVARANHAAITLYTGDVLVTGGLTSGGGYSDTAEIFSAQTGSWTLLEASLGTGVAKHAMATLSDGNVVIIGGESTSGPILNLLLFKPSDQSFTTVSTLITGRTNAAPATTPDGRVLIAGGTDINGAVLGSTEIFTYSADTMAGMVAAGPNLTYPRTNATATTTYDGVVVIGGSNGSADLGSAEVFSQWTNAFRVVNGATPRSGHIAALLPKNGSILAMGGTGGTAVDLLQPWGNNLAGAFITGAPSSVDHASGFAAPGSLGTMLAAGGTGSSANTAELYWFPTISTDQPDYAPGTPVVMTGVGFQPGETVSLYLREYVNKMLVDPPDYSVTADGTGSFTFMGYAPTPSDLGARYHLTAAGTSSGLQAQTIFTDSTSVKTATIAMQDSTCSNSSGIFSQGQAICANIDVTATNGNGAGSFFIVWFNPSSVSVKTTTEATALGTFHDVFSTSTANPIGAWTVKVCNNSSCNSGNIVTSTTFNLVSPFPTTVIPSPVTGTFGGTVNVSATLTVTSGGAPVSGQTLTFKLNGTNVGTGVTDSNGTATLSNVSLSGINAGTYASGVSVSFAGGSGYASSTGTGALSVNAATATINVTPYTVTYDSNPHTATGTATGVGGGDLSADLKLTGTTHTSAGTYSGDSWTFHDPNGNYVDASGSVTDVIKQATANITVTPYSVTYDATAHSATGTATGVASTDLSAGLSLSGTTHTNAGTYTDTWSFHDTNGNYADANGSVSDVIKQANATIAVTPYSVTYDGGAHTASGTATGVNSVSLSAGLTLTGTTHTNAATYAKDAWSFHDAQGNYVDASGTVNDVINKANATVTVTPYTVTYDGQVHTATVTSIVGVNGESGSTVGTVNLSTSHTNAGTYSTDSWNFVGSANYNDISSATITDTINKANATVTVTPYIVTYDGQAHTAAVASITGVNGETGSTVGTVDVSHTSHTNASTYATDYWTFAGTANYNNISSTTITDTINKANATVTVTPYTVTYDGQAHTAAVASITGVNGETGSTVGTVNVSNTSHTNASTYATDYWTFVGTANYNNISSTTITDTINKANATVNITPYALTYDGQAHSAIVVSIIGVNGETGSTVGTADVSGTTHSNAGTYASDYWTFTGTANYNNISTTTITDTINKANAIVNVTPYNVTYDGNAHTATVVSITGVNGETGSTVGTADVSNTTHTNAGTYASDYWTFTGTANYNNISTTIINDLINKANATVSVTPYNVTYDGNAHTAAAIATGVKGEDLSGLLDLSGTSHTNAGDYPGDTWSFAGNLNYNSVSGTTHDQISKANAIVNVMPYSVTYDGNVHTATGTAIGVKGEDLSSLLTLTSTTHTNAGDYLGDSWSFAGNLNYNSTNGTVHDQISKANATVNVTPYNVTYDSNAHTATGTGSGVKGESLSGLDLSGTTHTNAGAYTDSWTFTDSTGNYNNASGAVSNTISKANATVSVTAYKVTYDSSPHSATGSVTGVGGVALSGLDLSATAHSNAGTYMDNWSFIDSTGNYNSASGTVSDVIQQATANITVTPYSVTYDGNAHTATATATGVGGVNLIVDLMLTGTTHTNAGNYSSDPWTFHDSMGNYADASGTVSDVIQRANQAALVLNAAPPLIYNQNEILSVSGGTTNGTVTYNLVSGLCAIVSNQLTANSGTGSCVLTATMAGNDNYNDVTSAQVTVTLAKANQTALTLNAASPMIYSQSETLIVNGGTTNGTVTFNLVSGSCAVVGNQLTANSGTGACVLTATMGGNSNYNDVTSGQVTVNLAKANVTVAFSSVGPFVFDGLQHAPNYVVNGVNHEVLTSSATVSYSGTGGTTYSSSTAPSNPGSFVETVAFAANSNYNLLNPSATEAFAITYGFSGLGAPYAPPPTTFNVTRTMPLVWQYMNASGAVVNSAGANPQVQIFGPYTCGQSDNAGDITVNSAGASGYQYSSTTSTWQFNWRYQYSSTTSTWQFNWQVKGSAPGCYNIYIFSGQTGQMSGPFPIEVVSH